MRQTSRTTTTTIAKTSERARVMLQVKLAERTRAEFRLSGNGRGSSNPIIARASQRQGPGGRRRIEKENDFLRPRSAGQICARVLIFSRHHSGRLRRLSWLAHCHLNRWRFKLISDVCRSRSAFSSCHSQEIGRLSEWFRVVSLLAAHLCLPEFALLFLVCESYCSSSCVVILGRQ